MDIKGFLGTTNGKVTAGAVAVLIIAGIVAAIMMLNSSGNVYRTITAKEVTGSVNVTGDINNGPAYVGERLYGGDDVSVMDNSSLTMLMDNDKYLFAESNTHFLLKADQTETYSRIRIVLDKGSELNELRSSLSELDSYDVDTPNSTMSVRGTKFNVTVYTVGDIVYTLLEVKEGAVLVRLRTLDGTYTGVEKTFTAGESVLIRGGSDFSEFVNDENGETVRHLDLSTLPTGGTDRLIALLSNGAGGAALPEDTEKAGEPAAVSETESTSSAVTDEPATVPESLDEDTTEAPESEEIPDAVTEEEPEPAAAVTESTPAVTASVTAAAVTQAPAVTPAATVHTHTFGDWTVTKAADCANEGTETRKCSGCGATEDRAIPTVAHTFGDWKAKTGANCEKGITVTRTCSVCGAEEEKAIAPTSHKFGNWKVTKAAGCLNGGTETRTCSVCGTSETRTTPAAGHTYGEWKLRKSATCETEGLERRTCSVCGSYEERKTPALGHKFGQWKVTSDSTYDSPGTESRVCTVCGKIEEKELPVLWRDDGNNVNGNAGNGNENGDAGNGNENGNAGNDNGNGKTDGNNLPYNP